MNCERFITKKGSLEIICHITANLCEKCRNCWENFNSVLRTKSSFEKERCKRYLSENGDYNVICSKKGFSIYGHILYCANCFYFMKNCKRFPKWQKLDDKYELDDDACGCYLVINRGPYPIMLWRWSKKDKWVLLIGPLPVLYSFEDVKENFDYIMKIEIPVQK